MPLPTSVPGIADVEIFGRGHEVDLVVEVPHGADRRHHYDALRARMLGPLPADLHEFFHVNTDVGAWQVGRRVAEGFAARGLGVAVAIRCLLPRTFIDCNRVEGAGAEGGLTAGIPAYIDDERDRALLVDLHRRYVAVVEAGIGAVSSHGFVLLPHTYGPVTLGIPTVGADIVEKLRWAHEAEQLATWPLRPQVDLITRTAEGVLHAPERVAQRVAAGYRAMGLEVAENKTYHMHPVTMGYRWATPLPERVLSLEIRRDLLVREWHWNREQEIDGEAIERFAGPLLTAIAERPTS